MPKLTLRQTIILAVMCLVVLYGVYSWLAKPDVREKAVVADAPEDKQAFIGSITSGLGKDAESLKIAYAASIAETPWWNDPFLESNKYLAWIKTRETEVVASKEQKINFIYTGFVEFKGKKMAIINGDEYASGEKLQTNRHVLKLIDPAKVVIRDLSTMQEMTVPFQE